MLLINWTGLKKIYWVPEVKRRTDHYNLWFTSFRFLGLEIVVYSKVMATEFIRRFNREDKSKDSDE